MAIGYAFDELAVGDVFDGPGQSLTEDAVIAFAAAWDPAPAHRDREAARHSRAGCLSASPMHLLVLAWRLFSDMGIFSDTLLGVTGIADGQWLRPVRPGETVRPRAEVLAVDPAQTRPDRGFVRLRLALANHEALPVMAVTVTLLVRREAPGEAA